MAVLFSSGTSISTRYVNGRKMTTKKTFSNGMETVKVYDENDSLISHTVNGEPQAVAGSGRNSPRVQHIRHQYRHL